MKSAKNNGFNFTTIVKVIVFTIVFVVIISVISSSISLTVTHKWLGIANILNWKVYFLIGMLLPLSLSVALLAISLLVLPKQKVSFAKKIVLILFGVMMSLFLFYDGVYLIARDLIDRKNPYSYIGACQLLKTYTYSPRGSIETYYLTPIESVDNKNIQVTKDLYFALGGQDKNDTLFLCNSKVKLYYLKYERVMLETTVTD